MSDDRFRDIAQHVLRPSRREVLSSIAAATTNPQAVMANGVHSASNAVLQPIHLNQLGTAASWFHNILEATHVPKGLSDDEMTIYFLRLGQAGKSFFALEGDAFKDIQGTISSEQRQLIAQHMFDIDKARDTLDYTLGDARKLVDTLFDAEGFRGKALSDYADIARKHILENIQLVAPELAKVNSRAICDFMMRDGYEDVYDIPLKLIEKFGGDVPQALVNNWGDAYAHVCEVMHHEEIELEKAKQLRRGEVNDWTRNWFVVPSHTIVPGTPGRKFDVYCTEPDPRKQRTVLEHLYDDLRGQYFEDVTISTPAYNAEAKRFEFSVAANPHTPADAMLFKLGVNSSIALERQEKSLMA